MSYFCHFFRPTTIVGIWEQISSNEHLFAIGHDSEDANSVAIFINRHQMIVLCLPPVVPCVKWGKRLAPKASSQPLGGRCMTRLAQASAFVSFCIHVALVIRALMACSRSPCRIALYGIPLLAQLSHTYTANLYRLTVCMLSSRHGQTITKVRNSQAGGPGW